MRIFVLLYIICLALPAAAQYAPQAGVAGSTAISRDDKRFVAWANHCTVERGWMDIADQQQGRVSLGDDMYGEGKPDNGTVSLGDSGVAVLTFPAALYNGPGPDFAVFENGFVNPGNPEEAFLELAFVEVSSDGVNYVRFPATSDTDTPQVPGAGVYMDARKLNNLAGKYRGGYGTPFDLEELKGVSGLDVNNITHIRLVDVIGSVKENGTKDKNGHFINDPYPTAFASGGFDLDAVGAINIPGWWPADVTTVVAGEVSIYPNPAHDRLIVHTPAKATTALVKDMTGRQLMKMQVTSRSVKLDISHFADGVYCLILNDGNGKEWVERFSKY